jgi:hypothetical protein
MLFKKIIFFQIFESGSFYVTLEMMILLSCLPSADRAAPLCPTAYLIKLIEPIVFFSPYKTQFPVHLSPYSFCMLSQNGESFP